MPINTGTILFCIACLIAFGIGFFSYRKRRARVRSIMEYARCHDLHYQPHYAGDMSERLHSFPLFSRGHCRRVFDMLMGSCEGEPLNLFGWEYEVGFGQNHEVRTWTIALLETKATIPEGWVVPESQMGDDLLDAISDKMEILSAGNGLQFFSDPAADEDVDPSLHKLGEIDWPGTACLGIKGQSVAVMMAEYPATEVLETANAILCEVRDKLGTSAPAKGPF